MSKKKRYRHHKEIPKHKTALEEKYKENKVEEKDLSKTEEHKLPKPTGWRMLVLPFNMKDKTKGGLLFRSRTLERQQVGSNCG